MFYFPTIVHIWLILCVVIYKTISMFVNYLIYNFVTHKMPKLQEAFRIMKILMMIIILGTGTAIFLNYSEEMKDIYFRVCTSLFLIWWIIQDIYRQIVSKNESIAEKEEKIKE